VKKAVEAVEAVIIILQELHVVLVQVIVVVEVVAVDVGVNMIGIAEREDMIVIRKKTMDGVTKQKLGIIMVQLNLLGIQKPTIMLIPLPLGVKPLMIPMLVIGVLIPLIPLIPLILPKKRAIGKLVLLLLKKVMLLMLGTPLLLKILELIVGNNNLSPKVEMKVEKMKILLSVIPLQFPNPNLKKPIRLLMNTLPRKPRNHSTSLFQKLENLTKELMILSGKTLFPLKKMKKKIFFLLGKNNPIASRARRLRLKIL